MESTNLAEAYTLAESKPHKKLFEVLALAALSRLELAVAEKAFVRAADYMGLQFVKRLKLLDDPKKQAR
eukprot:2041159-Pleurochrysis_carterae.AAC.1